MLIGIGFVHLVNFGVNFVLIWFFDIIWTASSFDTLVWLLGILGVLSKPYLLLALKSLVHANLLNAYFMTCFALFDQTYRGDSIKSKICQDMHEIQVHIYIHIFIWILSYVLLFFQLLWTQWIWGPYCAWIFLGTLEIYWC
jgi:hypothetical protein